VFAGGGEGAGGAEGEDEHRDEFRVGEALPSAGLAEVAVGEEGGATRHEAPVAEEQLQGVEGEEEAEEKKKTRRRTHQLSLEGKEMLVDEDARGHVVGDLLVAAVAAAVLELMRPNPKPNRTLTLNWTGS